MLALAPPLHDRSSSHSAAVSSTMTGAPRSVLAARRAQSSSALNSAAPSLSSSSSSLFAPSASTVTQTLVPSSGAMASHSRAETSLASKPQASEPVATPLKPVDLQTSQRPALSVIPPMASPPPTDTGSSIDINAYPTPDLLRLLASLLNQIAAANDGLSTPPTSSQPSPTVEHPPIWDSLFSASRTALSTPTSPLTFHARNIPSISLEAYLLRILRYCPTTNEVFLSLLVYFDRISKLAQEATGSRFVIDSYNVHRLVIAGITVASKFFSDVFYTNSRYAKVGGLPQAELNQLELQFLLLNDFRLAIPTDEMQHYAEQLIRFSEGQTGAADVQANSSKDSSIGRPSRPLQSMGAFDTFGGPITSDNTIYSDVQAPRNTTPKRTAVSDAVAALPDDERDRESIISNETDTDAWTDDEPTIRPAHSCASSDTQSLFSNDDADADGDGNDDDDDDDAVGGPHHSQHSWNGRATESIDDDRHMASP